MSDVTYRRATGAVDAIVDGQVVLLSPVDLSYHALDEVGASVWKLLERPATSDELVARLQERYDVSDEQCRDDLDPFLARMIRIGALRAE